VVCVLVSAVSFGAMAVFAKLAYRAGADVHGVLLVRFTIASLALVIVMVIRSTPWPRGRDLRVLLAMGAIGYVGQSLAYFTALTRIPAGLVAVVFYTYPVLVTASTATLARRSPGGPVVTASALATVGAGLVAAPSMSGNIPGLVLAATAAVTYTGYILAGSRLSSSLDPLAATTTVCLAASAVYAMGALAHRPVLPGGVIGWSAAIATALISTVVAILMFFGGLRVLGPAPAAAISTVEPVITTFLAFLVFGEHLSGWQLAGAALVCGSVAAVSTLSTRSDQQRRGGSDIGDPHLHAADATTSGGQITICATHSGSRR
jgi:drug/metabolite transporter (DMT)-like permease